MIIQWLFNGFAWPVNAGQSSLSGIGTGAQKQGVFFGAETARFERDVVADQDHLPTMPGFRGVHGKQPRHHPNVVLTPRTGRFHCSRCLFIARMGEKKRKRKENHVPKKKKKKKESSKKNRPKRIKRNTKKNRQKRIKETLPQWHSLVHSLLHSMLRRAYLTRPSRRGCWAWSIPRPSPASENRSRISLDVKEDNKYWKVEKTVEKTVDVVYTVKVTRSLRFYVPPHFS